ncbi:hypothetical protein Q3G72_006482 [Acer saccharum]|nr:hypothetical protein Q3G72_006482 [Acer saccharum]
MVAAKDEGRLFYLISFAVATITAVVATKDEGRLRKLKYWHGYNHLKCKIGFFMLMEQDAMTSHIIVAATLSIWYPSLVKPTLATLVHPLMKLVMG